MKSARLFAPLIAFLPLITGLEKRQADTTPLNLSLLASFLPGLSANKTTLVPPNVNKDAKRELVRYGPFTLPANKGDVKSAGSHGGAEFNPVDILLGKTTMDPNGMTMAKRLTNGFCKNCTMVAAKTNVIFVNGTRADVSSGVYLHHLTITDYVKPADGFVSFCPGVLSEKDKPILSPVGTPFMGGAVDEHLENFSPKDANIRAGYHIKNSQFFMQFEIVNYRPEKVDVFVEFDLEYLPGQVGKDVIKQFISATGCESLSNAYKLKEGTSGEIKSNGFGVYKNGTVFMARGHMHDGGTAVKLYVNDKLMCSSDALYGSTGGTLKVEGKEWQTIAKMSECRDGFKVEKGDYLTISAQYDTKAHPARESHGEAQEGMGVMNMIFVPDE